MNFFDYFTQGLRNTIKFKNRTNFSFKGETVPVSANTVLDTWYMGDFTSAEYDVSVEYGSDNIEKLTLVVVAKVGQASLTVYSRTNLGRDLVQFSTTVNTSSVSLLVSPLYATDGITPLTGVTLTWKATYSERLTQLKPPSITGESSNIGGESGVLANWNNSNLPNGFMQVSDNGTVSLSNIGSISVPGFFPLTPSFILDGLNITNTDSTLGIVSSTSNNTITFSLANLPSLTVTDTIISTISNGSIDKVVIGGNNPSGATFTNLNITGNAYLNPSNQNIRISPSGTATLAIGPITQAGNIDNMQVGLVTAGTGKFKSLTVSQAPTTNGQLVTLKSIQARLLMGAI